MLVRWSTQQRPKDFALACTTVENWSWTEPAGRGQGLENNWKKDCTWKENRWFSLYSFYTRVYLTFWFSEVNIHEHLIIKSSQWSIVPTTEDRRSILLSRVFFFFATKPLTLGFSSYLRGHLFIRNSFSHRETTAVRLALTYKSSLPTRTETIMRLFLPEASLQSLPKRPQEMEFSKRIKTSREL